MILDKLKEAKQKYEHSFRKVKVKVKIKPNEINMMRRHVQDFIVDIISCVMDNDKIRGRFMLTNEKVSHAINLIENESVVNYIPERFEMLGCERILDVKLIHHDGKRIQLLFNNWYDVTIKCRGTSCINTYDIKFYMQEHYGFNGYRSNYADINSALIRATSFNLYMKWLEAFVMDSKRVFENNTQIQSLYFGLNRDGMAPEFTALKMLCMKRLHETGFIIYGSEDDGEYDIKSGDISL